jgi:hypothetical protein
MLPPIAATEGEVFAGAAPRIAVWADSYLDPFASHFNSLNDYTVNASIPAETPRLLPGVSHFFGWIPSALWEILSAQMLILEILWAHLN